MAYSGSYRDCICSLAIHVLYHSSHLNTKNAAEAAKVHRDPITEHRPSTLLLKSLPHESALHFIWRWGYSWIHGGKQARSDRRILRLARCEIRLKLFGAKSFERAVLVSDAKWITDQDIMCIWSRY
jgi:hypothetical protein